jgi:hypothetical protein
LRAKRLLGVQAVKSVARNIAIHAIVKKAFAGRGFLAGMLLAG